MKTLGVAAALLLTLSTAQAGENFSFEIGGRTVRIHAPRGCDSPSCISISIPSLYNSKRKGFDNADPADSDVPPADATAPPSSPGAPPTAPAQASAPASAAAPAAPVQQQPSPSLAAPTPPGSTVPPVQPVVATAPAPTQPTKTVAANEPAAEPVEAPQPLAEPVGPLGTWLTEKKEGSVRIEACGTNLCGYSVDSRSGRNKEKVLINMKPSGSKWSGKIYDPKSGSTYSSTVAMNGKDRLRVQGCAFGGMFCGGQNWTRLN